ncbi:UNVERIFIED_CONTAM: hypothetical protein FKN15_005648 [Acipenser sinensis]
MKVVQRGHFIVTYYYPVVISPHLVTTWKKKNRPPSDHDDQGQGSNLRERETETEKDVVLDPEELEDEHDQEENQNAKVDELEYVLNPEAEEFQFFDPIDETGRWDDDLAEEVIATEPRSTQPVQTALPTTTSVGGITTPNFSSQMSASPVCHGSCLATRSSATPDIRDWTIFRLQLFLRSNNIPFKSTAHGIATFPLATRHVATSEMFSLMAQLFFPKFAKVAKALKNVLV